MIISIETTIKAPLEKVWSAWTTPTDITQWNFTSDDWCCPGAVIDLSVGGSFKYRMEAKDGSMGFDFEGKFTAIKTLERIEFSLGDKRRVAVEFQDTGNGIKLSESFEAEDMHTMEEQRQGWQCILDNFKKLVESSSN